MKMELLVVMTLCFSMLIPCCSSLQIIHEFQNTNSPHHHAAAAPDHHQLPRKLRLMEQMTTTTTIKSSHTVDDDHQGRKEFMKGKYVEHVKIGRWPRVRVETWKEWTERQNEDDMTSCSKDDVLFTMDYSRVTRRRPIHNKTVLPVAP